MKLTVEAVAAHAAAHPVEIEGDTYGRWRDMSFAQPRDFHVGVSPKGRIWTFEVWQPRSDGKVNDQWIPVTAAGDTLEADAALRVVAALDSGELEPEGKPQWWLDSTETPLPFASFKEAKAAMRAQPCSGDAKKSETPDQFAARQRIKHNARDNTGRAYEVTLLAQPATPGDGEPDLRGAPPKSSRSSHEVTQLKLTPEQMRATIERASENVKHAAAWIDPKKPSPRGGSRG